jgi:hypothetical protein
VNDGRIVDYLQDTTKIVRAKLRESFLLRWVLANVAGWSVGLYLSAWSFFSTPALCLGGAFAGACLGAAQWYVLRIPPLEREILDNETVQPPIYVQRNWIGLTIAGAILGAIPALSAGFMVALGWGLGIALVGGIFGAGVGVAQWFILRDRLSRTEWWIAANVAGGALCALLTLAPIIQGLPIGLLLGTAVYGYITGRALVWLKNEASNRQDYDENPSLRP